MPRYFFHLVDGQVESDGEGTELADDEAAKREAVQLAGEVIRWQPDQLWDRGQWRVDVTDSRGMLRWAVVAIALDVSKPTRPYREPAANDRV